MYSREQAAAVASAWVRASEQAAPLRTELGGPNSFTIAISRQAGSNGTQIAREIGRRLHWPVYDNELIEHLSKELQVDVRKLENIDERPGSRLIECLEAFAAASTVTEMTYFRRMLKLVFALGQRGECVIVGRGAAATLPPATTLRVRLVAERDDRIANIMRDEKLEKAEATKLLDSTDHARGRFIKDHFRKDWNDPLLYDIVLNGSRLTIDESAQIVVDTLLRMRSRSEG
jgi:cytidylate kinase